MPFGPPSVWPTRRTHRTPGSPSIRRDVHQATDVILTQPETTATEAFCLLRAHADVSGRSVEDVSPDVVTRLLAFHLLPN